MLGWQRKRRMINVPTNTSAYRLIQITTVLSALLLFGKHAKFIMNVGNLRRVGANGHVFNEF
jgi:hypothetical protein